MPRQIYLPHRRLHFREGEAAASSFYPYVLSNSCMFNDDDAVFLSRTPSSAGNRKVWTFSAWVKFGNTTVGDHTFFSAIDSSNNRTIIRLHNNNFQLIADGVCNNIADEHLVRDPNSWGNFIIVLDTTQSTESERLKMYWNGTLLALNGYPSQNDEPHINMAQNHNIGKTVYSTPYFLDGYLAEVNFIDGTACASTAFGQFLNGVWVPIEYSGSYGTNGFYLDFADNDNLGDDESGNGNDFDTAYKSIEASDLCTGGSVSASNEDYSPDLAFNDTYDSGWRYQPTVYGTPFWIKYDLGEGNDAAATYYTVAGYDTADNTWDDWSFQGSNDDSDWDTLDTQSNQKNIIAWGDVHYEFSNETSYRYYRWNVTGVTAGKANVYVKELQILESAPSSEADYQFTDTPTNNYCTLNPLVLSSGTYSNGNLSVSGTENAFGGIGVSSGKWGWEITVEEDGSFGIEDEEGNEEVAADVNGEVVEMLLDLDSGTLKKKVDGGSLENIELSVASGTWFPYFKAQCSVDFGQIDYTPTEDGYLTLCTTNLSDPAWMTDPTIINPNAAFDVVTYTGNGSTQSISSLEFSPSIVWIKSRSGAYSHNLYDDVRGATNYLTPDNNATEGTLATGLTSFDSNGFSLGAHALVNENTSTYVAWNWLESVTYGIDIVEYEGAAAAQNIAHSLGVAPSVMIVKKTGTATGTWCVYHKNAHTTPEDYYLALDVDNAATDNNTIWNDTAPTSTQFTVGTSSSVNGSGNSMVAYLFAEIEGFRPSGRSSEHAMLNPYLLMVDIWRALIINPHSPAYC